MSKIDLAPTFSVVKLELQAALLGTRLATYIGASLTQPHVNRFFWTDNSCVRNWLRSSSLAYKTFVSHRIGESHAVTAPEEWRYVPGGLNGRDLTKQSSQITEDIPAIWFSGTVSLLLAAEKWSKDLTWLKLVEEPRAERTSCIPLLHSLLEEPDWNRI